MTVAQRFTKGKRMRVCLCLTIFFSLAAVSPAFSEVGLTLTSDNQWRIVGQVYESRFDGNLFSFTDYSNGELTFENRVQSPFATSGFNLDLSAEMPAKPENVYIRRDDLLVNNVRVEVYKINESLGLPPMQIWQFVVQGDYSVRAWGLREEELKKLTSQLTFRFAKDRPLPN